VAFQPGFSADVISYFVEGEKVSIFVNILRDGKAIGAESHILNTSALVLDQECLQTEGQMIGETLEAYLGQFYATHEIPDFVCVPLSKPIADLREGKALEEVQFYLESLKKIKNTDPLAKVSFVASSDFPSTKEHKGEVKKILKESYKLLLETGFENAKNRLLEKLTIDEKSQSELSQLQQFLGVPKLPTWLECYDISTFQGSQNVASGVVFRNGKPEKKEYRKYAIQEVEGQDDFASLREVTRRRFKEERKLEVPDVFLVDGGEPQVREVAYVLKSLGLDHVPLFGIAKSRTQSSYQSVSVKQSQERVLFPYRENGLLCPDRPPRTEFLEVGSAPYRLLTQIRDEAHRFAITFHRSKRDKQTKGSLLNEIRGVGAKTRKILLLAFGSVSALRLAHEDEIHEKTQLGKALIKKIKKALQEPVLVGLIMLGTCALQLSFSTSCKNRSIRSGAEAPPRVDESDQNPREKATPKPDGTAVSDPVKENWNTVANEICAGEFGAAGAEKRKSVIQKLANYSVGSRQVDLMGMKADKKVCVDEMKITAVYLNYVSGIPAGTLIGQALQETGFCASDLAQQANNFHGMKATSEKSNFKYWDGSYFKKSSTESVTGSGNNKVSDFMKFTHVDFSFYSVAERLVIDSLPYKKCLPSREKTEDFMRCVGKSWAVHGQYADAVLKHRADYGLAACELKKSEWKLEEKWR
jgi:flagellum-specific peptidoglycan hydrolase FlgJ